MLLFSYQKQKLKNKGFTLIEILISTVIIFLIVILVYLTYYNIERNTFFLIDKIKASEVRFNFLTHFEENLKSMVVKEKNFEFTPEAVSFETVNSYSHFPYKITYYTYQTGKGVDFVEKRKNLLTGKELILPVFKNLYNVNFEFYDGENWNDIWEKENIPVAIKITINETNDKNFSYVVKLPELNDERKK